MTEALLQLVVGDSQPSTGGQHPRLDALQQTALRAIVDHGGWDIDGMTFANYTTLVSQFGLPDSRDALRDYLRKCPS